MSVGSRSDTSCHLGLSGNPLSGKMKMDAVCVIDLHQTEYLSHRKKAFEEVKQACAAVSANCNHVQVCYCVSFYSLLYYLFICHNPHTQLCCIFKFEKLDFGETTILETFYNADVCLIDLSIQIQQSALFYHLGVRESFGMKENILLYNDRDPSLTLLLKVFIHMYYISISFLSFYYYNKTSFFRDLVQTTHLYLIVPWNVELV